MPKLAHTILAEVIGKKNTLWNEHSQIQLACAFINHMGRADEFRIFLNEIADEENATSGDRPDLW